MNKPSLGTRLLVRGYREDFKEATQPQACLGQSRTKRIQTPLIDSWPTTFGNVQGNLLGGQLISEDPLRGGVRGANQGSRLQM